MKIVLLDFWKMVGTNLKPKQNPEIQRTAREGERRQKVVGVFREPS